MSEETSERYMLEIGTERVYVVDVESHERTEFTGPDRLLAATTELNRLNAVEGMWTSIEKVTQPATPAAFLAETLPALARRQQLENQLAQVEAIKEHARSEVQRWQEIAQSAFDLRNRIREALARPLSATETAQNADLVGQDTLNAAIARSARQVDIAEILKAGTPLFKPGPY
jgi:hypothetical protein